MKVTKNDCCELILDVVLYRAPVKFTRPIYVFICI